MSGCIVVAVDGAELALRALDAAIDLSKVVGASIEVVHVVDVSKAAVITYGDPQYVAGLLSALRDQGDRFLRKAAKHATDKGAFVTLDLLHGDPAREIVRCAKQRKAGWIVMGSHGRSGLGHFLVGSVAEGVLRHSSVPVFVVPMKYAAGTSSAA